MKVRGLDVLSMIAMAVVTGCSSSQEIAYGPGTCREISKTSVVAFDEVTPLGFSANDFLAKVERTDWSVGFDWRAYDSTIITASSPSSGGFTDATVSIVRSSRPPRFIKGEGGCVDYLEVDVSYSIRTADGLLAEETPFTLTYIQSASEGAGETELQASDFKGAFRCSTEIGLNTRPVLGLTVVHGVTYGGLMVRYDAADKNAVYQKAVGCWPPGQG